MEIMEINKSSRVCDYSKQFITNSGLWKHKQKCNYQIKNNTNIF
jgi:hypothetical protein